MHSWHRVECVSYTHPINHSSSPCARFQTQQRTNTHLHTQVTKKKRGKKSSKVSAGSESEAEEESEEGAEAGGKKKAAKEDSSGSDPFMENDSVVYTDPDFIINLRGRKGTPEAEKKKNFEECIQKNGGDWLPKLQAISAKHNNNSDEGKRLKKELFDKTIEPALILAGGWYDESNGGRCLSGSGSVKKKITSCLFCPTRMTL